MGSINKVVKLPVARMLHGERLQKLATGLREGAADKVQVALWGSLVARSEEVCVLVEL